MGPGVRMCDDVYWIHLDEERDEWWTLVNTVMKFLVT
jgi:hypothetical protein